MTDARPLAGLPWLTALVPRKMLHALMADGKPARFVGGCVRDGLLGIERQSHDLDLATVEPPKRVITLLEAAGLTAVPTGLAHGTVTAVSPGWRFEITTLRHDVATDGRHATVAFTDDFRADAARRDFTINAMSCDGEGRLFDYFGGRADLAAGRIRFVGSPAQRIAEDLLRILRFFRFLAHYGRQSPDAAALQACGEAAGEIARLSGERIQTEMRKLLAAAEPLPSLRLMTTSGVLAQVIAGSPDLDRLASLLEVAPEADPLLRLAAMLRGQDQAAEAVTSRWRLSNRDSARLLALVRDPLPELRAAAAPPMLHRWGAEHFGDLARLAAAEGENGTALATVLARAATWQPRHLPLGGDDVIALGIAPGPLVGTILAQVEAWWVAHDFAPDHDACLAYAAGLLRDGKGEETLPSP